MYVENRTKIANFHTPRVFNAPADGGSPWNFVSAQGSQKTRMMGLSDGQKSVQIGLAVLIQYRSVTDTQPPSQPASHVAVAITLNTQASSLKRQIKRQQKSINCGCLMLLGIIRPATFTAGLPRKKTCRGFQLTCDVHENRPVK